MSDKYIPPYRKSKPADNRSVDQMLSEVKTDGSSGSTRLNGSVTADRGFRSTADRGVGPTELTEDYEILAYLLPIFCHFMNLYQKKFVKDPKYVNPYFGDFVLKYNAVKEVGLNRNFQDLDKGDKSRIRGLDEAIKAFYQVRNDVVHNSFISMDDSILLDSLVSLLAGINFYGLMGKFTQMLTDKIHVFAEYALSVEDVGTSHFSINHMVFDRENLPTDKYPASIQDLTNYVNSAYDPETSFVMTLIDFLVNGSYLLELFYNSSDKKNVFIGTGYDLKRLADSSAKGDYLNHRVLYVHPVGKRISDTDLSYKTIQDFYLNPPRMKDLDLPTVLSTEIHNNIYILYADKNVSSLTRQYQGAGQTDPDLLLKGRFFPNADRLVLT